MKGIFDYWKLQQELVQVLETLLQYDTSQEVRDQANIRLRQLNKEYKDWHDKNMLDDVGLAYLDRINSRYE